MFLDLGIGNSAMGRITEAVARHDDDAAVCVVRHAYLVMGGVTLIVWTLLAIAGVTGTAQTLATSSGSFLARHVELLLAFLAIYALVIPASFIQRIFFAFQRAGWTMVMQLTFSVCYLAFVVVAAAYRWQLAALVIGYAAVMLVVYGAFTVVGLRYLLPSHRSPHRFDQALLRALVKDGGLFFALQATGAIVYNSDQVILSSFADASAVAVYATTFKLFSVVIMANGLMLGPLWPAISDALATRDYAWVRSAYQKNLRRSALISCLAASGILLAGNWVLALWTHGVLQAPWPLLGLMAIWVVLEGYGQCMAMLLNAMRVVRFQLLVALALLVVGLLLKLELSERSGLYGPILGTVVAFVIAVAVPETIFIRKLWTSRL